ncbi:phosphoglyceromutase [Lacibacter luteus]|uniref:Phosphoglyceromutase n=1 Tax=Lacibacter luteus TaxID=2508719 RepID=A0A4Q1CLU1_9BACT|nr:alkaline phosphatase family protein [Lacibacter luteus]RXK61997.1 phosphoglyceromutase [Lacibacter luteus]
MRIVFTIALFIAALSSTAQKIENIIIVTTDGLRWQEVYGGMDSAVANNKKFHRGDSAYIFKHYWAATAEERRSKLMPFMWRAFAAKGQLYGNRNYKSYVNNANPYWFSYPGYSEIMTGYADTMINSNDYKPNPHVTVLEYFNQQPKLKGKVAAFGAWEAFDRILNEKRSGIPVVSAYDTANVASLSSEQKLVNRMLTDSYKPWHEDECLDVFTHYAALSHLKAKKPNVLYIAYGETDEWAHAGQYRFYLDAAHQVDAWLQQLWNYVQNDPQYKNKTALFITTDHGRGDVVKAEWTSHGNSIKGASEIWFAVMAPGVAAKGEVKSEQQFYQQQFAQTIARLLGYTYKAIHPVAEPVSSVFAK